MHDEIFDECQRIRLFVPEKTHDSQMSVDFSELNSETSDLDLRVSSPSAIDITRLGVASQVSRTIEAVSGPLPIFSPWLLEALFCDQPLVCGYPVVILGKKVRNELLFVQALSQLVSA